MVIITQLYVGFEKRVHKYDWVWVGYLDSKRLRLDGWGPVWMWVQVITGYSINSCCCAYDRHAKLTYIEMLLNKRVMLGAPRPRVAMYDHGQLGFTTYLCTCTHGWLILRCLNE